MQLAGAQPHYGTSPTGRCTNQARYRTTTDRWSCYRADCEAGRCFACSSE